MWFYILIFTFIAFLSLSPKDKPQWTLLFVVLFLIVLAGFRGDIDKDYSLYISRYEYISSGKYVLVEPFFVLISYIINYTVDNVIALFVIFAILGVGLKYLAIKKLSNFWMCSMLVYFSYFFFLHDMIQIRTAVASAVLLLSIPFIYTKNLKGFLVLILLGSMFHYSLIAVIPMYFINEKKVERVFLFLIPLSYLLFFLNINLSSFLEFISSFYSGETRFDYYVKLAKTNSISIFSVLQLIHIIVSYILLWKWKFLSEKNNYFIILLKFYVIGTFLYVAFADIPALGIRFSELFQIVEIILIPMLIFITKNRFDAKYLIIILSLFSLLLVTYRLELIKPYFN
ncbi:EpsG family protein [Yeosuana marina]|uniref:EpsG family protein n=1 Tax=Yeosuana marina TaxID=1565536 RepID=UPI0030EBC218|tara:strand:- start:57 stop:1082 length:1026 start_codon:yes stop_codon:yes gene_type:complete